MMNSLVSSGAVISSEVGMKMPCLESRSTTMRSVVWPEELGKVHRNRLPGFLGNQELLQKSVRLVPRCFGPFASSA